MAIPTNNVSISFVSGLAVGTVTGAATFLGTHPSIPIGSRILFASATGLLFGSITALFSSTFSEGGSRGYSPRPLSFWSWRPAVSSWHFPTFNGWTTGVRNRMFVTHHPVGGNSYRPPSSARHHSVGGGLRPDTNGLRENMVTTGPRTRPSSQF